MSIINIRALSYAASPTFGGGPISDELAHIAGNGDSDVGVCLQVASDGKTADGSRSDGGGFTLAWYFEDPGALTLPTSATINSVQISVLLSASHINFQNNGLAFVSNGGNSALVSLGLGTDDSFSNQTKSSSVMVLNPVSTISWVRTDLFSNNDLGGNGDGGWIWVFTSASIEAVSVSIDQIYLTVNYTSTPVVTYFNSLINQYRVFADDPGSPWKVVDAPDPTNTSVSPVKGPAYGGTVIN